MLCKSDLATEMIRDGKEFTKLQGIIGRYYAVEAGEAGDVADAIAEHLHPKHATDRLPEGELGSLIALADRLDSIAGCVLAGFAPTGGADPYALRRQALAILRMLLERDQRLDLGAQRFIATARVIRFTCRIRSSILIPTMSTLPSPSRTTSAWIGVTTEPPSGPGRSISNTPSRDTPTSSIGSIGIRGKSPIIVSPRASSN